MFSHPISETDTGFCQSNQTFKASEDGFQDAVLSILFLLSQKEAQR